METNLYAYIFRVDCYYKIKINWLTRNVQETQLTVYI
jgi:hypothetical protein